MGVVRLFTSLLALASAAGRVSTGVDAVRNGHSPAAMSSRNPIGSRLGRSWTLSFPVALLPGRSLLQKGWFRTGAADEVSGLEDGLAALLGSGRAVWRQLAVLVCTWRWSRNAIGRARWACLCAGRTEELTSRCAGYVRRGRPRTLGHRAASAPHWRADEHLAPGRTSPGPRG
eukprot:scaffold47_cov258-Pinguiococcus_pyrenoidosus.AAC.30